MKGTAIIASGGSGSPRGLFDECIINGTPKPGVVMEMDDSVAAVGNRFTWQPYGTTAGSSGQGVDNDGDRKIIAILTEDRKQGGIFSTAYVSGNRGYLYFPAMGETFNMLVEDVGGTGDDFFIGEEMMVDNGTGKLLTHDSDAEAHPFTCLEEVTNPTADHWMWVRFNGSAG